MRQIFTIVFSDSRQSSDTFEKTLQPKNPNCCALRLPPGAGVDSVVNFPITHANRQLIQ